MNTVTRIEKLTQEQENRMASWAQEWIDRSLNTEPVDKATFERAVAECYRFSGFAVPETVIWCASPLVGRMVASLVASEKFAQSCEARISGAKNRSVPKKVSKFLREAMKLALGFMTPDAERMFDRVDWKLALNETKTWHDCFGGYFWSHWPAFERFFADVCHLQLEGDNSARGKAYAEACMNSGWFWTFENVIIATEKHTKLTRDAENRLHNEKGHAIAWADGSGQSYLHGVCVPDEWLTGPVDPKLALTHPDVEQRRVLREFLGWTKILPAIGGFKVVHEDSDPEIGTLLECDLGDDDGRKARFLKMKCGTGREFIERVDPTWGDTALEVQNRRWGLNGGYAPEVRT
jgi:hypothetical protein